MIQRPFATALLALGLTAPAAGGGTEKLHERLLVLDSHLDTPTHFGRAGWDITDRHSFGTDLSQVDLPRMVEGGLDGGFWVIYVSQGALTPEAYAAARDEALLRAAGIRQMVAANGAQFELATAAADAARIAAAGRRVVYQSIENSYPLGEDLSLLATFHKLGVRMAGPVHSRNNQFADSATEIPRWGGLSPLGREWVREMNRLGMLIDGSHASDTALRQLLELSRAPIVLSHSGPKAIFGHPRNLDDGLLREVAAKGGVIQVNSLYLVARSEEPELRAVLSQIGEMKKMSPAQQQALIARARALPSLENSPGADFELFMRSLLHVIEVAGVDHVGIGADWDGGGGVAGLGDVAALPKITAALQQAGYGEEDIARVWSGNLLRVLAQAERVRDQIAVEEAQGPAQVADTPEARLAAAGHVLPPPPKPVATYATSVQVGNLLFLSGHGECGREFTTGKLGRRLSLEQGVQSAQKVGLCMLATIKAALGDLSRVKRFVRILGMVNADHRFKDHPKVMNGFSDLMVLAFGEGGYAARSAVGMSSLPSDIAVEIEAIVEIHAPD